MLFSFVSLGDCYFLCWFGIINLLCYLFLYSAEIVFICVDSGIIDLLHCAVLCVDYFCILRRVLFSFEFCGDYSFLRCFANRDLLCCFSFVF